MCKKTFVFNCEWQEVLVDYPAEVRLEVYDAIIEYVATGTLSELKPMAKMAFSFIKKEIDYNNQKYADVIVKRIKAGQKGNEVRWSDNYRKNRKCDTCDKPIANIAVNVNDNVNVNVNDNDNDIIKESLKEKSENSQKPTIKKQEKETSDKEKEWQAIFSEWLDYKRERKESYKSARSVVLALRHLQELSSNDTEVARQIIEQSMANNYAGLFELKSQKNGNGKNRQIQVGNYLSDTEFEVL
jgi:hypothetical protein